MTYFILAVFVGLVVLVKSADWFVQGASATAKNMGVSTLIIGLTIIGFGTSAPELIISSLSSFQGSPGLAIGNAIGSNITNIALVLGFAAVLSPLAVESLTIRRELPILMGITCLTYVLLLDDTLAVVDGVILLTTLFGVMFWLGRSAITNQDPNLESEFAEDIPQDMSMSKSIALTVLGLILLMASAQALVWGASNIAREFGVSELVIGLTIVAIGTSLPELAAAIAAVRKNEHDLVLGNVIGSNLFNTLGVIGLPAIIAPGQIPHGVVTRDMPINIAMTILMIVFAIGLKNRYRINRIEGGILLASFVAYQFFLFVSHQ